MTPMQKQYNEIKQEYPDHVLLFRLGDFYECFHDDAKIVAKTLGITLTGRGKDESRIPMAGIPYHALNQYLPKLTDANIKVAIAEQLSEPKQGEIVKRGVTKVITAGTITDEKILDDNSNNYLLSIYSSNKKTNKNIGISFIDLTTGEFYVFEEPLIENKLSKKTIDFIRNINPRELLIEQESEIVQGLIETQISEVDTTYLNEETAKDKLLDQFGTKSLKSFGIENLTVGIVAAVMNLEYLKDTQKTDLNHIKNIKLFNNSEYMNIDSFTYRNLEVFYSSNGSTDHSLYSVMNNCNTSMGQRMLRNYLLNPLKNKDQIEKRTDTVKYFSDNVEVLDKLRDRLNNVYDIERILGRLGISSASARDLLALASSLKSINEISKLDFSEPNEYLNKLLQNISNLSELEYIVDLIENSIDENPPVNITEGGIIRNEYSKELDELREINKNGKSELINIQQTEISRTGISSLKVKFNNVFGYYIEISKSNLDKVPEHYVRKQTVVNAERFITDELKVLEEKILGAKDKIIDLEYELFNKIRNDIAQFIPSLQEVAKNIAHIDVLSNFAYNAIEYNYVQPQFSNDRTFNLKEARHPVIESISREPFIPNDLEFDNEKNLMILTGPNMSGKSTYIRQVAIISLMAHIGSFVPASKAEIPVLDRIFTRVGASDNLVSGESTFMVEMNETANILNNATENSLIILDEIGRGTSTYDGISIAWAITEYIHNSLKSYTLFATHYHEMLELHKMYDRIVNYNVKVVEQDDKVIFMRKIEKGGTDKSYGIYVGQIAGLPKETIERAKEIMSTLEDKQSKNKKELKRSKAEVQFSLIGGEKQELNKELEELKDTLSQIDINNITPLEALQELSKLIQKIN